MIVTRRRRKPFPWRRYLFPALGLALLTALLAWVPARTWVAGTPAIAPILRPFDAAAQMRTIAAQNDRIAVLQAQLGAARTETADRDRQIAVLRSQMNAAFGDTGAEHAARAPAPVKAASDLTDQATAAMRRTASVWSAMDSGAAAKVVQHLPDDYVARVFAVMTPDAVGAILEDAPVAYAARLTQDRPELQR